MKKLLFFILFSSGISIQANSVIEFSEEELARESVFPVFKDKAVVKEKRVPKEKRFELAGFIGSNLNESFYEPITFGGSFIYHLNEFHGFEFHFNSFSTSISSFEDDLNSDLQSGNPFDFSRAPTVESLVLLSWEFTPFYGKISLTKQTVWNLATYFTFSAGMANTGDGSNFAFGAGIGQKFYFTRNWGLKVDLRAAVYQAPYALSNPDALRDSSQPAAFDDESTVNLMLTVGPVFLLPSL